MDKNTEVKELKRFQMTTLTEKAKELIDLAGRATPGPYKVEQKPIYTRKDGAIDYFYDVWHSPDGTFDPRDTYSFHDCFGSDEGTTYFIAACSPEVITEICEKLIRYEKALERIVSIYNGTDIEECPEQKDYFRVAEEALSTERSE